MQLIVLGMHRSGTSGVTRLLNLAGAWFGPEGIATDANEENPKGFWERRDVRAVCDGLLQDAGFDWWRISGFSPDAVPEAVRAEHLGELRRIVHGLDAHRPWVVKEPRLCLLFPLVRPLLEAPVCIHVTREPLEVAQSVHARGHAPVQAALALWEAYTIAGFEASRGLPRLHVRHEDVMADPVGTLEQLLDDLRDLGVQGLRMPSTTEVEAFISPDLHRQHRSADERGLRLSGAQARLASAVDDGSVLDLDHLGPLSEGAREELRLLEEARDREEAIDALRRQAERDAAAHAEQLRIAELRTERHDEQHREAMARAEERAAARATEHREALARAERRRRDLQETALDAIDRIERDVRAIGRSRAWQIGAYLTAIRRTVTPGMSRRQQGPLGRALGSVDRARRSVGVPTADDDPAGAGPPSGADAPLLTRSRPSAPRTGRKKVAVLTWDAGHNPIGRANVMAEILARRFDVEIWGAQFERYGSRVWAPLREASTPIVTFAGLPFPDHLAQMERVAREIDADALWVCKPRLPSYLLGAFAKEVRNRPLVLDVDDHELAFFATDESIDIASLRDRRGDPALELPFERLWTQACDPLIGAADRVTVSNPELQARYGGVIVPHARDERLFDPARWDRDETRRDLGIDPSTRLLLFGGTPRIHKGVVEVLQALEEIGDDRYRVLVFGTRELDELRPHIGHLDRWAVALPYQRFEDLPRIVGAADLACVLQDPTHPVARYQMPAKVTDSLAMAVPTLVRPVAPLAPLVEQGALNVWEPGTSLAAAISAVFDDPGAAQERAELGRKVFLESYSYEAVGEAVAPMFEELIADPPPMSPALRPLLDVPRALFGGTGDADGGDPGAVSSEPAVSPYPARVPEEARRPIPPGAEFDVVMFWKQNDTGIYGRRQDMFLEYLRRSGRVRRVVHFDNPITPEALVKTYRQGSGAADQSRLVVRQTLERLARRRDVEGVSFHTFVHAGPRTARFRLPARAAYVARVRAVLARRGVGTGARPVVLWAYPTNPDLPALIDALDPDLVVADVVDDNRTWYEPGSPHHERIERNYAEVLVRSDLVIANCEPVAEAMRRFAPEVHVVPNGLELPGPGGRGPRPRELQGLHGPVIGYVGNLSSRIDIDLLEGLARARPGWQFAFVGSAHLDGSILRLGALPNVHFLGVKPHREARRLMEHFDVALIPHVDNEMTRAMNPLKAFVYCAAGVPVVSTPIANLGDLGDLITVAHGTEGFLHAIEEHLRAGRPPTDLDRLRPHAWDRRVAQVLDLIDGLATADPASGDDPGGGPAGGPSAATPVLS